MKIEIKYCDFVGKITALLDEIFGDKLTYVYYLEDEERFVTLDISYSDYWQEMEDVTPLADLIFELDLPDSCDIADIPASDINAMLSLAVQNLFIINKLILTPAGHNLFGYNYNDLTGYEYDFEKDILYLMFKD